VSIGAISYQTISEGGEVEHSVYYNEGVENIVKQYFQKLRVRRILGMLLVCLVAVLFYCLMDIVNFFLLGVLVTPLYLLSLFFIWKGISFFNIKSFTGLSTILYYDCDPVKYQEVLSRLLVLDKRRKVRAAISLELATAVLAQGKAEEGARYLEQATFKTFTLDRELKKLGCYADYRDLHDDFIGLHQIEEKLYEWKANVKEEDYFDKEIEHQISLVQAMASREHESINSQRERWVMLYSTADNPLQENLYLMRLARLELAQGKREISMRHMGFVVAEGNALPCVNEAKQILSAYETANSKYILNN